jgi:hypothetical protein
MSPPRAAVRNRSILAAGACCVGLVCLTACSDRNSALEECRVSGLRFFPSYSLAELNSPGGRYLVECMAHHGYEFRGDDSKCDGSRPLVLQEACFAYGGIIKHLLGRGAAVPSWLGK